MAIINLRNELVIKPSFVVLYYNPDVTAYYCMECGCKTFYSGHPVKNSHDLSAFANPPCTCAVGDKSNVKNNWFEINTQLLSEPICTLISTENKNGTPIIESTEYAISQLDKVNIVTLDTTKLSNSKIETSISGITLKLTEDTPPTFYAWQRGKFVSEKDSKTFIMKDKSKDITANLKKYKLHKIFKAAISDRRFASRNQIGVNPDSIVQSFYLLAFKESFKEFFFIIPEMDSIAGHFPSYSIDLDLRDRLWNAGKSITSSWTDQEVRGKLFDVLTSRTIRNTIDDDTKNTGLKYFTFEALNFIGKHIQEGKALKQIITCVAPCSAHINELCCDINATKIKGIERLLLLAKKKYNKDQYQALLFDLFIRLPNSSYGQNVLNEITGPDHNLLSSVYWKYLENDKEFNPGDIGQVLPVSYYRHFMDCVQKRLPEIRQEMIRQGK